MQTSGVSRECVTRLVDAVMMPHVRVLIRVRAALQANSAGFSGGTAREESFQVDFRMIAIGVSDVELNLRTHDPAGTNSG